MSSDEVFKKGDGVIQVFEFGYELAFPELLRCELKIKHNSSPNRLHGARLLF
jgi:hypothetical protein